MKFSHIVLIIIALVGIGVVISTVVDSNTYANFATAKSQPDREFHIIGTLAEGKAIEYNQKANPDRFAFYMEDSNGEILKVFYDDAVPVDFEKSEQIVIIGRHHDTAFFASSLLLKCPSKYNESEIPRDFETKSFDASVSSAGE